MNHLLPHFILNCGLNDKNKTGGLCPAKRLTFVHAATKASKTAFSPCGGHLLLPGFRDVKNLL